MYDVLAFGVWFLILLCFDFCFKKKVIDVTVAMPLRDVRISVWFPWFSHVSERRCCWYKFSVNSIRNWKDEWTFLFFSTLLSKLWSGGSYSTILLHWKLYQSSNRWSAFRLCYYVELGLVGSLFSGHGPC